MITYLINVAVNSLSLRFNVDSDIHFFLLAVWLTSVDCICLKKRADLKIFCLKSFLKSDKLLNVKIGIANR